MQGFRITASLAASLSLIGMAAPAGAGGRDGRHDGHHRHHDDRINAGDVVLGAVIAGGVIALAAALSGGDDKPDDEGYAEDADYLPEDPYAGSDFDHGYDSLDAAIAACADAAEYAAQRFAPIAQLDRIDATDPGPRGWYVRGTVALRSEYRDPQPDIRGFRCSFADGAARAMLDI